MNNHTIIGLFFAFILMGFAGWWYVRAENTAEKISVLTSTNSPNAFAKQITIVKYDKEGRVNSRFETPHLSYYPNKNSQFDKPHIIIYKTNEAPWIIDAEHGTAKNGTDIITFWNDVRIHQQKSDTQKETTILTERIRYYPQKNYVETQQTITLRQPDLEISSVGLKADLNKEQFNLLSHVQGHYEKVS